MSKERGSIELMEKITNFVNTHWYPAAYSTVDEPNKVHISLITDPDDPTRIGGFVKDLADYHDMMGAEAICLIGRLTLRCFGYIEFDYEKYSYEVNTPETLCQISDDLNCCINRYDITNRISLKERFVSELVDLQDMEG